MTDKIYVTWNEFHQDCKLLAEKLRSGGYNRIIAISRGGLLPAGVLAYELNIKACETVSISSYDDDCRRKDADIEITARPLTADSKTLIIDDLSDSGRTFQILRKLYPDACLACLYAKPQGKDAADIFVRAMPDRWLVFPWDI